jgi:hypothetical protein
MAPRCAENLSPREKEFIADAHRARKNRAQLEDLWKLSIQAERVRDPNRQLISFRFGPVHFFPFIIQSNAPQANHSLCDQTAVRLQRAGCGA